MQEEFPENKESEERAQKILFSKEGIPPGLSAQDKKELTQPVFVKRRSFEAEMGHSVDDARRKPQYEEEKKQTRQFLKLWNLVTAVIQGDRHPLDIFEETDEVLNTLRAMGIETEEIEMLWADCINMTIEKSGSDDEVVAYEVFSEEIERWLDMLLDIPGYAKNLDMTKNFGDISEWLDEDKYRLELHYNIILDRLEAVEAKSMQIKSSLNTTGIHEFKEKKELEREQYELEEKKQRTMIILQGIKNRLLRKGVALPKSTERFDPPSG